MLGQYTGNEQTALDNSPQTYIKTKGNSGASVHDSRRRKIAECTIAHAVEYCKSK